MKRRRTAKKKVVLNRILAECEEVMIQEKTGAAVREASVLLQALVEAIGEVKTLDNTVSDLIDNDEELQENVENAYKFVIKASKVEFNLKSFVTSLSDVVISKDSPFRVLGVKLPRIKIKSFDGAAINWRTFIEAFNATVHARADI